MKKISVLIFATLFSSIAIGEMKSLSAENLDLNLIENSASFDPKINTQIFDHKPLWQDQNIKQAVLSPINFAGFEAQAAELRYQSQRTKHIANLNQQIANNPAVAFIAFLL